MQVRTRELKIDGKQLSIQGRWLTTARLVDEWYEDVDDPEGFVRNIKNAGINADLFSFWQRLPHTEPKYTFFRESDPIAVLPITTYDEWLRKQINNKTRNLIAKAGKKGVITRPATFDDEFIRGITAIFNETPVRQGMPFWHYGKDFETIKQEFSRFLFREDLFGAYLEDELIGFIFVAHAGRFAVLGQIISMMRHRDKAVNNALVAKAVEVCAEHQIPFLAYAVWPRGPLKDFKRHNGFNRVDLPRYYIPLTTRGKLALRLGLHKKLSDRLPDAAFLFLRDLRSKFYLWQHTLGSARAGETAQP